MRLIPRLLALVAVAAVGGTALADDPHLLSTAEANLVAKSKMDQVKQCYLRHALIEPRATGRVRVDVDVRADGGVARARVVAPGFARRHFERCVVARALTWRFPASSAATEVRMPFRFSVPVRLRSRASS
jgi:TonB family protein